MGNLRSIGKACEKFVPDVKIINFKNPNIKSLIKTADVLILPGVGAFRDAIANLKPIAENIVSYARDGGYLLGICLGFQLFFSESEEGGLYEGLNIFEGRVVRFPNTVKVVPHMGWNTLEYYRKSDPMFENVPEHSYVYFVHSYYAKPKDNNIIITQTDYEGVKFASTVGKNTVYATQYHPEKSSKIGLQILQNFLNSCRK